MWGRKRGGEEGQIIAFRFHPSLLTEAQARERNFLTPPLSLLCGCCREKEEEEEEEEVPVESGQWMALKQAAAQQKSLYFFFEKGQCNNKEKGSLYFSLRFIKGGLSWGGRRRWTVEGRLEAINVASTA